MSQAANVSDDQRRRWTTSPTDSLADGQCLKLRMSQTDTLTLQTDNIPDRPCLRRTPACHSHSRWPLTPYRQIPQTGNVSDGQWLRWTMSQTTSETDSVWDMMSQTMSETDNVLDNVWDGQGLRQGLRWTMSQTTSQTHNVSDNVSDGQHSDEIWDGQSLRCLHPSQTTGELPCPDSRVLVLQGPVWGPHTIAKQKLPQPYMLTSTKK